MSDDRCAVGEYDSVFEKSDHGGIDRFGTRRNAAALSFAGGEGIAGQAGHREEDLQQSAGNVQNALACWDAGADVALRRLGGKRVCGLDTSGSKY